MLHPDVVLRTDDGGGALRIVEGARAVATGARLSSRGRVAHPAIIDGAAGFVATEDGTPVAVLRFTIAEGQIIAIDALAGPAGSQGWISAACSARRAAGTGPGALPPGVRWDRFSDPRGWGRVECARRAADVRGSRCSGRGAGDGLAGGGSAGARQCGAQGGAAA